MLIYITLCALSLVTSCSTLAQVSSTNSFPNIESNTSEVQFNVKRDIWAILNPSNLPNDSEENDSEISNVPVVDFPKLTIWEFPTERRVFIGDVEVFINSKYDNENSHEAIDLQNSLVLHPHKRHRLHNNIANASPVQFPDFRAPKSKQNDNEEANDNIRLSDSLKRNINGSSDDTIIHLSRLNRDKRNVKEKGIKELENDFKINHKISPGPPKDRRRRTWNFYDYLKRLLNDLDETTISDIDSKFNENNKDEQTNDMSKVNSNNIKEALKVLLPNNADRVINHDNIVKTAEKISSQRIQLLPVNPDLINILLEDYDNNRRMRSIDSESHINLLINDSSNSIDSKNDINLLNNDSGNRIDSENDINLLKNDSDEDDNTGVLFDNFNKFVETGKVFYSILIEMY